MESTQTPIEQMADAVEQRKLTTAIEKLTDDLAASNYAAGELLKTEPAQKSKFAETEFWVLLLTIIGTVAGAVEGWFDGNVAVGAATVQAIAYSVYRQLSKTRAANTLTAMPLAELVSAGDTQVDGEVEFEDLKGEFWSSYTRLGTLERQVLAINRRINDTAQTDGASGTHPTVASSVSPPPKGMGHPTENNDAGNKAATNGVATNGQVKQSAPDGP